MRWVVKPEFRGEYHMSSAVRCCFAAAFASYVFFAQLMFVTRQVISLSAFDVAPAYGTFAPSVLKVTFSLLIFVWVA